MNQTRTLLIFAWLMVAVMLWMEWRKEANVQAAPDLPVAAEVAGSDAVPSSVPSSSAAVPDASTVPIAPPAADGSVPSATASASPATGSDAVTVVTDVLRLTLDRGNGVDAALLAYPQTRQAPCC